MVVASADTIEFKGDIDGNATVDDVTYYLRSKTSPSNPNQKLFSRKVAGGSQLVMDAGVTKLKFAYYYQTGAKMAFPITGARLDSIRAVRVTLDVESSSPSMTYGGKDTIIYNGAHWDQFIVPKAIKY